MSDQKSSNDGRMLESPNDSALLNDLLSRLWSITVKPLIEDRNEILELHHNTLESFDLPQIKKIDRIINTFQMGFYYIRNAHIKEMILEFSQESEEGELFLNDFNIPA